MSVFVKLNSKRVVWEGICSPEKIEQVNQHNEGVRLRLTCGEGRSSYAYQANLIIKYGNNPNPAAQLHCKINRGGPPRQTEPRPIQAKPDGPFYFCIFKSNRKYYSHKGLANSHSCACRDNKFL